MTPVGFEPTPLRNGALSHRLRPLGQSVLGSTFWLLDSCYTTVLGDLSHKSRYLWAQHSTWSSSLRSFFGQGLLCYGKGNGVANESHCAAVDTFTTRHSTANGISLPGKVTPVGFEPTPLRNGALSHRLRPLGQSVLGSIFWHPSRHSASLEVNLPG